jgi:hypothetical protein
LQALGTEDADFANELLRQLSYADSRGDEDRINFLLSVIKGVKPKDQLEAMLAAQMAVTHSLTMTFARRLNHVMDVQQQDSAERAFNKLARTFTTQMEALKRYRTGGDQKVTVQNVSVSEGGQAIVGNVSQTPRANVADNPAAASPQTSSKPQADATAIVEEDRERVAVRTRPRAKSK